MRRIDGFVIVSKWKVSKVPTYSSPNAWLRCLYCISWFNEDSGTLHKPLRSKYTHSDSYRAYSYIHYIELNWFLLSKGVTADLGWLFYKLTYFGLELKCPSLPSTQSVILKWGIFDRAISFCKLLWHKLTLNRNPGLVVMEWDFVWKKPKINEKGAGDGPIF